MAKKLTPSEKYKQLKKHTENAGMKVVEKDLETLKKQKGIGLYARPEKNTSAGKTAPPERMSRTEDTSSTLKPKNMKSGGRVNLRGGGMCKRGMNKKAYGRNS